MAASVGALPVAGVLWSTVRQLGRTAYLACRRTYGDGMDALLGVVIGGLLTALGSLIVGLVLGRRTRDHSMRDQRMNAAREVLSALQELNRRLIDLARIDCHDHKDREWPELHEATIRWNSARFSAALIAPDNEVELLKAIDLETDRVMGQALVNRWDDRGFREERRHLGELGAKYLNLVRQNEELGAVQIKSLWPWAEPHLEPAPAFDSKLTD
jgi:hypothetical protein